jgi:hypothetical protein
MTEGAEGAAALGAAKVAVLAASEANGMGELEIPAKTEPTMTPANSTAPSVTIRRGGTSDCPIAPV